MILLYEERTVFMKHHRKNRKYDGDFRKMVIETMHQDKSSYRETANKFGIKDHKTVINWERIYYEQGPEALYIERRGLASLATGLCRLPAPLKKSDEDFLEELQRLRAENAYLKKLQALVLERERQEKNRK